MAFTFNGIGTTFYGKRDYHPDTSYVTTEWIVLFYLPLLPLRSFRVRPTKTESNYILSTDRYDVLGQKHHPHWRQVLYTYSYLALLVGSPILLSDTIDRFIPTRAHHPILIIASIACWLTLLFLPYLLRRRARHLAFAHGVPQAVAPLQPE